MQRPPPRRDRFTFDVEKELDEVIGQFEDRRGSRLQRWGRILGRVLLGASLAMAAAAAVIYTLHSHVRQAQIAPPKPGSAKPVPVQIIPERK
ncbi:MAG TPA: hypothetical protein VEC19_02835 [Usitatibacter sp.]|nr:hypothetical protein [Usitatibacter sp.]